jgi:hypothetical protein
LRVGEAKLVAPTIEMDHGVAIRTNWSEIVNRIHFVFLWIHSRRTPSGKYLMVWADKDEMRRLKQLARVKPVRIRARHPDLIIPKRRTAR